MRYVVLNPVRAGMVSVAGDWRWSSYGAMVGTASRPEWLQTDWGVGQFGSTHGEVVMGYMDFVRAGVGVLTRPDLPRFRGIRGPNARGESLTDLQ